MINHPYTHPCISKNKQTLKKSKIPKELKVPKSYYVKDRNKDIYENTVNTGI